MGEKGCSYLLEAKAQVALEGSLSCPGIAVACGEDEGSNAGKEREFCSSPSAGTCNECSVTCGPPPARSVPRH